MILPDILKNTLSKPIAVFGLGVTGNAVVDFLKNLGLNFNVYDQSQAHFTDSAAKNHSLVIYSQGFPPHHPWLQSANRVGALCLGELDFGALFCKAPIVCITGTNGKTSTTEFLAHALRHLGKQAVACGNCGTPLVACSRLFNDPNAFLVCETSSFQAETLQYLKPHSVLWTNFFEDHLDRHPSMEAYFKAKYNLVHQAQHNPLYTTESVAKMAKIANIALSPKTQILSPLPGPGIFKNSPQQANFALVKAFWDHNNFPLDSLYEAAESFAGVPHRMQFFDKIGHVAFWNDSKGTNFSAVLEALKTFNEPIFWIGGGKSKGGNIKAFASELSPLIHKAYLIGETTDQMSQSLSVPCQKFTSLETATQAAFYDAKALNQEAHVILSPGFASFDMFPNYTVRGNSLQASVLLLKKASAPV